MIRQTIFFMLIFLIIGCNSTKNLNLDNKSELVLDEKSNTFDSCTNFSYIGSSTTKEFGQLFIEYINLDSSCKWNGLSRGFFVDLFKSTLKIDSFKLIERKDFKNYEFSTYLVDEKYFMNIIYIYTVYEDYFIIDYNGIYSNKLIKQFDENYINLYLNKPRFFSNYKNSLVRMNILNSYFSRQKERFER